MTDRIVIDLQSDEPIPPEAVQKVERAAAQLRDTIRDDLIREAQIRAVYDVLVRENMPLTRDEPPYPACLMPIAAAVVDALFESMGHRDIEVGAA